MNRPPEILINTGYVTDEDGVLTGLIIPSSVNTLTQPKEVTFQGETMNWVPPNCITLNAPKLLSVPGLNTSTGTMNLLQNNATITTLNIGLISLDAYNNSFATNSAIVNLIAPRLVSITGTNNNNCFQYTKIVNLELPSLKNIGYNSTHTRNYAFGNCSQMLTVNLPSLERIWQANAFQNCTALTTVNLGSAGHPVLLLHSSAFAGCTQTGLTITVYTQGGAALAGEPWGATNATIEYEEA